MDHQTSIESALDALLLNASKLQEASSTLSVELSHQQNELLNQLFAEWSALSEDEQSQIAIPRLEEKMVEISKQNEACLKKIQTKDFSPQKECHSLKASQLDFSF